MNDEACGFLARLTTPKYVIMMDARNRLIRLINEALDRTHQIMNE